MVARRRDRDPGRRPPGSSDPQPPGKPPAGGRRPGSGAEPGHPPAFLTPDASLEAAVPKLLAHLCTLCRPCASQLFGWIESEAAAPPGNAHPETDPGLRPLPAAGSPKVERAAKALAEDRRTAHQRLKSLLTLPPEGRTALLRSDPSFATFRLWTLLVDRYLEAEPSGESRPLARLALAVAEALDPRTTPAVVAADCVALSWLALAQVEVTDGGLEAAESALRQADLHAAAGSGDTILAGEIALGWAQWLTARDRPGEAAERLRGAVDAFCQCGEHAAAAEALTRLGLLLGEAGESAEARGALTAGLLFLGAAGQPDLYREGREALAALMEEADDGTLGGAD